MDSLTFCQDTLISYHKPWDRVQRCHLRRSTPEIVLSMKKKFLPNSTSKMANSISICNSTGRSEIWDKYHEL